MDDQEVSQSQKIIRLIDIVAGLCIFLGVVFMCQPLSMKIYSIGFPTILGGTVAHIILDHL